MCRERGLIVPMQVVDHRVPRKGDMKLFFDPQNLQSLCKDCHDRRKAPDERAGATWSRQIDASGWPLDPQHRRTGRAIRSESCANIDASLIEPLRSRSSLSGKPDPTIGSSTDGKTSPMRNSASMKG